jgi:mevalonate kinase
MAQRFWMKNMSNKFYAKVLLFGEYGIIKGSKGVAMPFSPYYGVLSDKGVDTSSSLQDLFNFIKRSSILKRELDVERMDNDINNGLEFRSNIPQGQGLGSSGALCASLYSKYSNGFDRDVSLDSQSLKFLQEILSLMESYFHGTSSGLDPLVSLINKPLMISSEDKIAPIEYPSLSTFGQFYLLDTKIQRKTSPLVHQFLKDCSDEKYFDGIKKYMNLTDLIVDNLSFGQPKNFSENFKEISRLQYLYFDNMIPKSLKDVWLTGLESKDYFLKLCGAGGGGYFIVYSDTGRVPLDHNLLKLS